MRIVTGRNAAGNEVTARGLVELGEFLTEGQGLSEEIKVELNTALSEAMINVAKHAYPEEHSFQFRHVNKWWMTAEADRSSRTLTVVIYDQGATIPVTLPKKLTKHALLDLATRLEETVKQGLMAGRKGEDLGFLSDSAYIAYAMQEGTTQTGVKNRGLGIPQMKDLIDLCGNGHLSIMSRGGRCTYTPAAGVTRSIFPCSIGGTLIEWTLILPVGHDNNE